MMGMVDPPRLDKQDIAASLALKHRDRGASHFRERRLSGGVGGPVGLIAHMIGLEEAEKVRYGRKIGPLAHRGVRNKVAPSTAERGVWEGVFTRSGIWWALVRQK